MLAWYGRKQGNGGTRTWLLPPRTIGAKVGTRRLSFFCSASLNRHGPEIDLSRTSAWRHERSFHNHALRKLLV